MSKLAIKANLRSIKKQLSKNLTHLQKEVKSHKNFMKKSSK